MKPELKEKLLSLQSSVVRVDDYGKHYASGLIYNDLVGFIKQEDLFEMEYEGVIFKKQTPNGIVWSYTANPNSEKTVISQPLLFHIIRNNPKLREELRQRNANVDNMANQFGGRVVN